MRWPALLLTGLMLAMAVIPAMAAEPAAVSAAVTRVVVNKAERQLLLYAGDQLVRRYPVSLGDAPVGHKTTEGDERTPEGDYRLDWRNPNSRYHRSIHISYPNAADRAQAKERGVSPGGDIMIHGLPNGMSWAAPALASSDWTDGCIALTSNDDMDEVWQLVRDGTPIRINP